MQGLLRGERGRSRGLWLRRLGAAALLAGAGLLLGLGCASPPAEPLVLASSQESSLPRDEEPSSEALAREGPVRLAFRGPGESGTAYRLLLEMSGEREFSLSTDQEARKPLHESHLLELEYRELPVESAREQAYRLALDALHYRLLQREPDAEREIELGDDRLRVLTDGKVGLDLRGAQPKEQLTPRKLLGRVFAVVVHDGLGNPVSIPFRGAPPARRFLHELLVKQAVGYSRLPLPEEPIAPGAVWHGVRYPVSPAGSLGLRLEVDYALAGFQELDGVACAWILLRADESGEGIESAAGFRFDRVEATLTGSAWVELESARLRRLVLEDEVRASYTRGQEPRPVASHHLRHRSRLALELRDPKASTDSWADGSPRFGRR